VATRSCKGTLAIALLLALIAGAPAQAHAAKSYLGFDENLYPGNAALPILRQDFSYAGYWLNPPPGMKSNPWTGKRPVLRRAGFGFLILFNGRLDRELRRSDATALGATDAAEAVRAARREGFPPYALIFLDLEEGGRMLPEQLAYIGAWLQGVRAQGFRAGVYCSGIEAPDGPGKTITTAHDIATHFPSTPLWVANDACPPAPGCVARALPPSQSGFTSALVWQFAQSPRRRQYTQACGSTYARDGNCYAPQLPHSLPTAVDLNTSASPDPSGGR
jgi:hypothetical protein